MVNIVKLPCGQEYHLDAAFGGDGPTKPVPLVSGQISQNLGPQEIRLIHDNISKQTRPDQKLWIYQYRNGSEKKWESLYSFAEIEFFQDDFEVINHYTSWETFSTGTMIIVKFIRGSETDGLPLNDHEREGQSFESSQISIAGKIMFISGSPDVVKLNMGGQSRIIDSFQSEEERLSGLKRWFQIQI
ncbi:Arylamine N-acetyltransferase [Penicillium italicum]|uniref:Arylamine N-acetyltransferase n=1 Tax=Penicillium italicum TaxID=40296 RepID=A0A0A2KUH4_PENIT|nr:Arylamine N-acetyltransferase [Penicillium italicum]